MIDPKGLTNIVFALEPAVIGIHGWSRNQAPLVRISLRFLQISMGFAVLGFVLGFLPQMLAWKAMYGSFLSYSYQGEKMDLFPRHAFDILFGPCNSLFIWTPIALLAVAGLFLAARRGQPLAIAGVAIWLATIWIYGSWSDYKLGASFGMRGFVECSLFFILGLGELMRWVEQDRWQRKNDQAKFFTWRADYASPLIFILSQLLPGAYPTSQTAVGRQEAVCERGSLALPI